jgi:hypothetical protein
MQLGFQPQPAVRWLMPPVLISTGIKALLAGIFGSFADKRELQQVLPGELHAKGDGPELWFDFVADLGDGFDATYSIASLLAADKLETGGHSLPRGELLVMGGDEVYPAATSEAYEDRTKGPYRMALPTADKPPALFALPGNHDWYDGLTAFLRVFAQRRKIGGWQTEQGRSYFAIDLPHRWRLFAVDTQFDEYIDAPQLEYFRRAAADLQPGDLVILCTPTPAWVKAGSGGDPRAYDIIQFFEQEIVKPTGAEIRVMLSGDSHHYARYEDAEGQRITCGGGGAYLTATHLLPKQLTLPPPSTRIHNPPPERTFAFKESFPSREESAKLAKGIFRLPLADPGFWGLTALLQTVLAVFLQIGLTVRLNGVFGLFAAWAPAVLTIALVVVAGVVFAGFGPPRTGRLAAGLAHSLAHLALSALWAVFLYWLQGNVAEWVTAVVVLVGTPILIGFIDAEIVALYLVVASQRGINLNEAFAGQSIEDYKSFLRLHIDTKGELTIYPVKVPTVCRKWREEESRLVPDKPLEFALIEDPIKV